MSLKRQFLVSAAAVSFAVSALAVSSSAKTISVPNTIAWGAASDLPNIVYISAQDTSVKVETDTSAAAAVGGESSAADGTAGTASDKGSPETPKPSPETGIEDVAAIAGIGVIALGALIIAKKRN